MGWQYREEAPVEVSVHNLCCSLYLASSNRENTAAAAARCRRPLPPAAARCSSRQPLAPSSRLS